jgi:trimeric autotransporter adhesin
MTKFNFCFNAIAFNLIFIFSANAQVSVIKDIVVGKKGSCQDTFSMMTVGTKTFFTANNDVLGNELWVTDGTEAGTKLVKDIYAGALSSNPQYFMQVNNTFCFFAQTAANGLELWKSDGTEAGTVLLKDINMGPASSFYATSAKKPFAILNNQAFFIADNGMQDMELWKTDGTAAGTVLVKDIVSGSSGSYPSLFTIFNNKLYMEARGNLWQSDGTTAGTTLAKAFSLIVEMVVLKSELLIGASDGTATDLELWKTNGTVYTLVKDIDPRKNYGGLWVESLNTSDPMFITYGDYMYFPARDTVEGTELWRTDGTTAGTTLFKIFQPGKLGYAPQNFRIVKNTLMFKCENANRDITLFKTDGTVAGTKQVKSSANDNLGFALPTNFFVHKDLLYMNATIFFGFDLWRSDGTDAGTVNISKGNTTYGLQPSNFVSLSGKLLFRGETLDKGFELMGFSSTTPVTDVPINNNNVQISPNPAQNEMLIDVKSSDDVAKDWTFNISNSNGQIVKSGMISSKSQRLNCVDLPNGFYILRVQTAHWQSIKKVAIQH